MPVTLLDGQGEILTEIRSRAATWSGRVLVDWASRPDVLFRYYFDRGGRAVSLLDSTDRYAAFLGTRWQMGARFWFLHKCEAVHSAPTMVRISELQGVLA